MVGSSVVFGSVDFFFVSLLDNFVVVPKRKLSIFSASLSQSDELSLFSMQPESDDVDVFDFASMGVSRS